MPNDPKYGPNICPKAPPTHMPNPYSARPISPLGWDDPAYSACNPGWSCTTANCVRWGLQNGASVAQIEEACAVDAGVR